jgi:hypothetical protein
MQMLRRFIAALTGSAVLGLTLTAVAAAATPTTTTGVATAITQTTALLHGHIDPHGVDTDFDFNYGPTVAYGATTVERSAGSGTVSRGVDEEVTGLEPGTAYHFQITAVSATGTEYGLDMTFTTAGAPPSTVDTGPAVSVGKTVATATGAIDPNGSATPWEIQYGLTAAYGLQTFPQAAIAPGFAAVPVSFGLSGLAPATLFHYRVVAFHGAIATYGADATFFTEPDHAPSPDMTTTTTPSSDRTSAYTFTTSGTLKGGTYIPAAYRCTGTVGIRYFNGPHQLAYAVAAVSPSCTFSAKVSFQKTDGSGSVAVRIVIYHRGTGYLAGESKTNHVHAGR